MNNYWMVKEKSRSFSSSLLCDGRGFGEGGEESEFVLIVCGVIEVRG